MEGGGFIVEPGFVGGGALIAAAGALLAGGYVDVDEDGDVGLEAGAGDAIELEDDVGIEAAAAALVAKGGIGEAIAEDDGAAGQSGADDLFDILSAAGEVKQEFRAWGDLFAGGIEQDLTNQAADFGATGLDGFHYIATFGAQRFAEKAHLRGLPAAVNAFKGDEFSSFRHALGFIVPKRHILLVCGKQFVRLSGELFV